MNNRTIGHLQIVKYIADNEIDLNLQNVFPFLRMGVLSEYTLGIIPLNYLRNINSPPLFFSHSIQLWSIIPLALWGPLSTYLPNL